MTEDGDDAPPPSHGLVKEAELTQHRSAVIVDALARQPVIGVKRIDRAKRELHPPPSRWQAAPRPEMRTPDRDLQNHAVGCRVPVLYLDCQIGQRAHELGVIRPHAVAASAVIPPRLVIVPCVHAERRHHSVQVMAVLAPDVFVHHRHARLYALRLE